MKYLKLYDDLNTEQDRSLYQQCYESIDTVDRNYYRFSDLPEKDSYKKVSISDDIVTTITNFYEDPHLTTGKYRMFKTYKSITYQIFDDGELCLFFSDAIMNLQIEQYEDEWFKVKTIGDQSYWCDQLDGLMNFIKDWTHNVIFWWEKR